METMYNIYDETATIEELPNGKVRITFENGDVYTEDSNVHPCDNFDRAIKKLYKLGYEF